MQTFTVPSQQEIWDEVPDRRILAVRWADDTPLKDGHYAGSPEERQSYLVRTVQIKGEEIGQVEKVEERDQRSGDAIA
jgi:uncharacterized protein with FMN-binding domain